MTRFESSLQKMCVYQPIYVFFFLLPGISISIGSQNYISVGLYLYMLTTLPHSGLVNKLVHSFDVMEVRAEEIVDSYQI